MTILCTRKHVWRPQVLASAVGSMLSVGQKSGLHWPDRGHLCREHQEARTLFNELAMQLAMGCPIRAAGDAHPLGLLGVITDLRCEFRERERRFSAPPEHAE